jgi:hypothetical protein
VVVPDDIVTDTIFSSNIQGWRLSKSGNADVTLDTLPSGAPASIGDDGIHMTRTGGSGINRSYLGYYKSDLKLSDIEKISWNR